MKKGFYPHATYKQGLRPGTDGIGNGRALPGSWQT